MRLYNFYVLSFNILLVIVLCSLAYFYLNIKIEWKIEKNIQCEPFRLIDSNVKFKIDGVNYPQSIPLYLNKSIDFNCLNAQQSRIPKILFWNTFFGDKNFAFGLGVKKPFIKNECPVFNCETLNDRTRLNEADFVIVHMRDHIPTIPKQRPLNQRWIFTIFESPMYTPNSNKYNNVFNFTSTYRVESEFSRLIGSYQMFEWAYNKDFDQNRDFSQDKTEFAAAVIGNCGGSSGRLAYIKELEKHVPVTLLGKCGQKCENYFKNASGSQCKELVAKKHRFYLSFENSICNGYISEKFFQILRYEIIPVVLGGGNYSFFIPKSGFINVLDYKSPKDLADYLKYLASNKTAYNSYFKWKKYVQFRDSGSLSNFCDMCIQLNLEKFVPVWKNTIQDIGSFWDKKQNCKKPMFDKEKNFFLQKF